MIKVDIFDDGNIIAYNNTIADSVMFEKMQFNFPESWIGYAKTAVFRNGENTISVVLNSDSALCTDDNECYVPYEVIKAPQFTVSVFGVSGDSRATTPQVRVIVRESGYGEGDTPSEPTPTEYEQILSLANATKQIAQSIRDDADSGAFKGVQGEIGPQGPKGEIGPQGPQGANGLNGKDGTNGTDGYTPKKGIDYFTDEDIDGLNIPSVDQIFNPASENAQSGKAVAEAVNTFFSDKNMELIKEITLTEDVGLVDILTKDEGIELRDTFIFYRFLFTESGDKYIALRKDAGNSYYGHGLYAGGPNETAISSEIPYTCGHLIHPLSETGAVITFYLKGVYSDNVNIIGRSQGLNVQSCEAIYTNNGSSQKIDNLNMFLVGRTETNLIKAGSKIWLYGRKVK